MTAVNPPSLQISEEKGIRLIQRKHSRRGTIEIYVEATQPKHGLSPRRFYVGTLKTSTQEKVDIAVEKAKLARKEWLSPKHSN